MFVCRSVGNLEINMGVTFNTRSPNSEIQDEYNVTWRFKMSICKFLQYFSFQSYNYFLEKRLRSFFPGGVTRSDSEHRLKLSPFLFLLLHKSPITMHPSDSRFSFRISYFLNKMIGNNVDLVSDYEMETLSGSSPNSHLPSFSSNHVGP